MATIINILEWVGFGIFLWWFLTKDKREFDRELRNTMAYGKLPRIGAKTLRDDYFNDAYLRVIRGEEGEALKNLDPYDKQRAAWKIAENEAKRDGWIVEHPVNFDLEKYRGGEQK